jgi:polysaccharide chain length determinant protein (PEP-CTERM system associated)
VITSNQPVPAGASGTGYQEFRHYLGIIRRRKAFVILATVGFFFCAVVVARRLPDVYRSQTVILVDAQQVPSIYVQSTVSTSLQDRLSTIQQQVMSPTRLANMIEKNGLFPELRGKVSMEMLVQKIQKSTSVDVAGHFSSFRIGYQGENPKEVSEIANELALTFISENEKATIDHSKGTAEFLDSELQETKSQLESKEQQLQNIKATHVMDLSDSKQFHLETLNNLRTQLAASEDRVRQAKQSKVMLESVMNTTAPTVEVDGGSAGGTGSSSQLEIQIEKQEAHLAELRSRYGPNFPDVRKAQAEIERLKKKAASEKPKASVTLSDEPVAPATSRKNPVIEAQIQKLDQEIDEQTKLQGPLQEQIDFHLSKLERVPIFEQEIAGLMRDYDSLRSHYQSLLDKKLSAQMAAELDARQKGERFVVLDLAPVPDRPSGPNRVLISLAGLILGLVAGIGLAMAIEMTDESVRTEHEAAELFGIPVLAGIPEMYTPAQVRSRRMRLGLATILTAALSSGLGLLISIITRKIGLF